LCPIKLSSIPSSRWSTVCQFTIPVIFKTSSTLSFYLFRCLSL
jgi:hypothetical protein